MIDSRYLLVRCRECGTGNPLPRATVLPLLRREGSERPVPRLCTHCGHTLSDREMREAWRGEWFQHFPRYHYQIRGSRLLLTALPPRPTKRRRRLRRGRTPAPAPLKRRKPHVYPTPPHRP